MALAVFIIDIRASVEHKSVATELRQLVATLQTTLPCAKLQIAWGDEVEGVLPTPVDIWDIYVRTRHVLGPLPFYMAVGFGEVADDPTLMEDISIHQWNGTAFKAARGAVEAVKREMPGGIALGFNVYGNDALTRALNGYPRMLNAAWRQMTHTQRAYFDDWILGYSRTAIAVRHGVSQPTVSKVLQRAGGEQLEIMRGGLASLLAVTAGCLKWCGLGGGEAS